MDKQSLKETFKWINPEDIELGSFGLASFFIFLFKLIKLF